MKTIKIIVLSLLAFCFPMLSAQETTFKTLEDFLPEEEKQKTKVLLVGAFHFNYPGMDAYKTDEQDKINVLSPKRQAEVQELAAYKKAFFTNSPFFLQFLTENSIFV